MNGGNVAPSTNTPAGDGIDRGKLLRLLLVFAVVMTVCLVSPSRGWFLARFNSVSNHVSKQIGHSITETINSNMATTTTVSVTSVP